MYLGVKASSVREGCGKWGVVAVEEIPARSFVCTVAGQVRARPWPPRPPRLLCSTCRCWLLVRLLFLDGPQQLIVFLMTMKRALVLRLVLVAEPFDQFLVF